MNLWVRYEWWEPFAYSAAHFGLSALVGFLVYLLTLTIQSRICSASDRQYLSGSGIPRLALLAALSSSVLVHVLEDYFVQWF